MDHIVKQKNILSLRAAALRAIRDFFWSLDFTELDAPAIVELPGQEPNLSPMQVVVRDEHGTTHTAYLHTSPEYIMKRALSAGMNKIFFLGKCYRDNESFGGAHHPEFTMLEWYRRQADMVAIMDDTEALFKFVANALVGFGESVGAAPNAASIKKILGPWKRTTMRELWHEYLSIDLDNYLDTGALAELSRQKGFAPAANERYEELFYRIFLNHIEPRLAGEPVPIIISHYPAQMAALARLDPADPRYAERFELYIDGVEMANAFSELCDAVEQRARFLSEQDARHAAGLPVFPIDEHLLAALEHIPSAAGIALGADRMIQYMLGCKNICDVLVLPLSKSESGE